MSRTGLVVKNYNGYYYVASEGEIYPCKIRGRLKKERFSLLTGDKVVFTPSHPEGSIEEILERKNRLIKPAIANVDQIVLVFSLKNPDFNQNVFDRFLVLTEQAGLPVYICLSKADLLDDQELLDSITELYQNIGYKVLVVAKDDAKSFSAVKDILTDKITVFAGMSGVGKSTLLNQLFPRLQLSTGEVSDKNNRGRHTTRFSQLIDIGGGYIADTPGFSSAHLEGLVVTDVQKAFREFARYSDRCRYLSCQHIAEPDCGVKDALANGLINAQRYQNYCSIVEEIKEAEERKYK